MCSGKPKLAAQEPYAELLAQVHGPVQDRLMGNPDPWEWYNCQKFPKEEQQEAIASSMICPFVLLEPEEVQADHPMQQHQQELDKQSAKDTGNH